MGLCISPEIILAVHGLMNEFFVCVNLLNRQGNRFKSTSEMLFHIVSIQSNLALFISVSVIYHFNMIFGENGWSWVCDLGKVKNKF